MATAAQTPAGPLEGWRGRRPSPGRAAGAKENVATSLTTGWRKVETSSALARRQQPWWGPSPRHIGGEEGDRCSVLGGSAGRDRGAFRLGREGLTQETAAATVQHTAEASTTWDGRWSEGNRGHFSDDWMAHGKGVHRLGAAVAAQEIVATPREVTGCLRGSRGSLTATGECLARPWAGEASRDCPLPRRGSALRTPQPGRPAAATSPWSQGTCRVQPSGWGRCTGCLGDQPQGHHVEGHAAAD